MKFKRQKMVNWYDPEQLAFTAIKTVISGVFGNFADRREMQAALDPDLEPYDFSNKTAIWLDYISDLGDGFDSTYTLAHLLAQDQLEVESQSLKRGNILIMGGDQVYPTPELEEYNNRLKGPYNAAYPWVENDPDRPSLFAVPGNHDWYDGLTNFLRLFCQGRSLGNWHSKQRRSYFALKLPYNTWLLGIDIQLNADIDYPQLCYFKELAKQQFQAGDRIILCTAEPSWVYKSFDLKNNSYDRLQFFINKILHGEGSTYYGKNKSISIITILTGDLHHYSRYEEIGAEGYRRQLITAGGGGAFMHPTHPLKDCLPSDKGRTATLKKTFPEAGESRKLSLRNLLLPFYSSTIVLFFGLYHLITLWLLQTGSRVNDGFFETNVDISLSEQGISGLLAVIGENLRFNPAVLALHAMLWIGIFLFTDTRSGRGKWNYFAGGVHASLHLINFYFLCWLFARWNIHYLHLQVDSWQQILLLSVEMILVGGGISAVLFGIYLLFSISVLDNHITEASSSYRWEGYKNFLRLHLTAEGLTIYPIGIEKVVKNWKNTGSEEEPKFEGDAIEYQLIENPIFIPYLQNSSEKHASEKA